MPNNLIDGNVLTAPVATRGRITVGGAGADVSGFTSAAIQIAVDALTQRGGGTVELKPGSFTISAPVRLSSNITLTGAGQATVLRKADGYRSPLAVDADYGMFKVTVQDARGFAPGMGVQISDAQNPDDYDVTIAVVLAVEGNTLFLNEHTLRDYDCRHKGVVTNASSIIEAVGAENVRIANLEIDGNRETNDPLSGCRGGAVYLHKSAHCVVENVLAKNFNGDVFDWQITRDVTVHNCEASHSSGMGFHPGTGSENTLVEGCRSHDNLDGIYLCWRVKNSKFQNNTVYANARDGISVNRKDTDNRIAGNHVYGNGRNGIYFNNYDEANNSHRNLFEGNVIENNGARETGYGFSIAGTIRDISIRNNQIRDTGKGTQRGAVLLGPTARNIQIEGNTMSGHPDGDVVHR